ncbi:thioesterase family protein [Nocardioides sp. TF02-7]|uniref:acyl-CoA thioesterase n=1 Tax=Nocardioides sp. TF02-7 TaxID=2917724 RepID=UPI001F064F9F|nr:thioesterase family protein [Nocardioides sp. TF02-7]UMG91695.1 acyl-CoA thioesterase [Nocardioides sp. TF02-7]
MRFSDVDVYRHVNNVVYFEYFQESRIRLFMDLSRDLPRIEQPVVVAHIEVDYLAPILLRAEPYDCWTRVARIGRTSAVLESEIVDGDRPLARARVVLVFVDPQTQQPAEPDPVFRRRLQEVFDL